MKESSTYQAILQEGRVEGRVDSNAAEKTRAYRERRRKHTSEFEEWAEQATDVMRHLRQSVIIAQHRGDVLALSLRTENLIDLMQDLASHFNGEAAANS